MKGKTVIFSALIMSLVMAQIQVEGKICCPSTDARTRFFSCLFRGGTRSICAGISGCKIVDGECPEGYSNDILEHSGDAINEYCKLGCASSVCSALITLENSDASEIVNGAVEKCTKACSNFCTKGSKQALETTA